MIGKAETVEINKDRLIRSKQYLPELDCVEEACCSPSKTVTRGWKTAKGIIMAQREGKLLWSRAAG